MSSLSLSLQPFADLSRTEVTPPPTSKMSSLSLSLQPFADLSCTEVTYCDDALLKGNTATAKAERRRRRRQRQRSNRAYAATLMNSVVGFILVGVGQ